MRALLPLSALAFLAGLLLAALAVSPGTEEATPPPPGDPPPKESPVRPSDPSRLPAPEPTRFLAWGDAGHGSDEQRASAETARRVCEREGCDFVLMLGDNVYPAGVHNESDPQFREKFEDVYAGLDLPFYAVLGNHDVALGRVDGAERDNGDFMVAYDARSERWTMPARHYALREGPLQVIALDLTATTGPGADPARAEEQLAWLEDAWDGDAAWRVAAGHFPYVSNGRHGNATGDAARFLEEGVCGRAHLYLAGHDHDLQWLRPAPSCEGTEHVVSGAVSEPRPLKGDFAPAYFARGETLGFFWFEATEERLTGRAYDVEGNVLFERTLRRDPD